MNQAKAKLTGQWQQHTEAGTQILNESEEWNEFYKATYAGLYPCDADKTRFINHLQKDVQITFTDKTITGNQFFESKVSEDR